MKRQGKTEQGGVEERRVRRGNREQKNKEWKGEGCRVKVQENRWEGEKKEQIGTQLSFPHSQRSNGDETKVQKINGWFVYVKRSKRCNNKGREEMVNVGERTQG